MSTLNIQTALRTAIGNVIPKTWKQAKRRADQQDRVRAADLDRFRYRRLPETTIKEAAFEVMPQAYLKASAGGTLPANARQIMYAARPLVLALTKGKCWSDSAYFTQILLPDFVEQHAKETDDWDVVYDARGHLAEPHTGCRTDLGTIEVRDYLDAWEDTPDDEAITMRHAFPTRGPLHRYRHVLFVEKEGFNPLFEHVALAARFDLGIMSTKGMSVTAARQLVEALSNEDVTILVVRDLDKAGFTIVRTLRSDTRRYQFTTTPNVVDLGLRLDDVEDLELESEPVTYKGRADPRWNLREAGATEAERAFLVREAGRHVWLGQRVELNAMTSDQLVTWLEAKLRAHGVAKLVPERPVLEDAYRRAHRLAAIQQAIDDTNKLEAKRKVRVPADLEARVREALQAEPNTPWDTAVWNVARASMPIRNVRHGATPRQEDHGDRLPADTAGAASARETAPAVPPTQRR